MDNIFRELKINSPLIKSCYSLHWGDGRYPLYTFIIMYIPFHRV